MRLLQPRIIKVDGEPAGHAASGLDRIWREVRAEPWFWGSDVVGVG
jgi:hypothetical protein